MKGTIYSINSYQALGRSWALPLGAGDTEMAFALGEVMQRAEEVLGMYRVNHEEG